MDLKKIPLYDRIVKQVANEFQVPETLIWEILSDMYNRINHTILNFTQYIYERESFSIYIPVLGKLVCNLKTALLKDVRKELQMNKPEDGFVSKKGYLVFRKKADEHRKQINQYNNNSNL